VANALLAKGARAVARVDRQHEGVTPPGTEEEDRTLEENGNLFFGDVTDEAFQTHVYQSMIQRHGIPRVLVPAAGITRDKAACKIDKQTGKAVLYPKADWDLVSAVNLKAAVFWALELTAHIGEDRFARGLGAWEANEADQGAIVFIGSVSSEGNRGQISYAATKAALAGVAATINYDGQAFGVRAHVIHPGYTDTEMVRDVDRKRPGTIESGVVPHTQLKRLIRPEEIAAAVCFLIENPIIGRALWADAGWHAAA
jgi:NAD(P)-dependent dehydrogenase (short-subunit alcohol dehydrogenase family)